MPANQEMVMVGWNHRLPTGFGTKSPQLMALIDLVVQSGSTYGHMVRHVGAFVALGPTVVSNRVTGYRVRNTNTGNGDYQPTYGGRVASVEAVALPPNGLRYSICEMCALWDSVTEESPHIPPAELRSTVRQPFFEGILAAKAGVDGGDALSGPRRPIPCGGWPVACSSTLLCT